LIRRFLHYSFALLKTNSWDLEVSSRFITLLFDRTFFADDKFRGDGVNYHIASVFLDELRPFLPVRAEVVSVLLKPFVSVLGKLPDKVLSGKIRRCVFEVLLNLGFKLLEVKKIGGDVVELGGSDEVVLFGTIALTMGFSGKFYELGSAVECCQGNRKVLFGLYEEFAKLEKDYAASGIVVSIPDIVENGDDEEVPSLVPIGIEVANDDDKPLKKCKSDKKKKKKDLGGSGKLGTKKKKKENNDVSDTILENSPTDIENGNLVVANGENSIEFNESVISNLQMQFEKVAAEAGLDNDVVSACDLPKVKVNGTVSKKRKRSKSKDEQKSHNHELNSEGDAEGGMTAKSGEKSAKKVRFSMKNNLVWKPHSPLPPQDLRLPPSVTPRGSALKKGVPPGPIMEMPLATKMVRKRAVSVKKVRKGKKSISPAAKRLKKLKSRST
jgi:ribosomal RNA-processing protein 1